MTALSGTLFDISWLRPLVYDALPPLLHFAGDFRLQRRSILVLTIVGTHQLFLFQETDAEGAGLVAGGRVRILQIFIVMLILPMCIQQLFMRPHFRQEEPVLRLRIFTRFLRFSSRLVEIARRPQSHLDLLIIDAICPLVNRAVRHLR